MKNNVVKWVIPLAAAAVIAAILSIIFLEQYAAGIIIGIISAFVGLVVGFWLIKQPISHLERPLIDKNFDKHLPVQLSSLFLFNTLHNIKALMLVDTGKADEVTENLAGLVHIMSEMNHAEMTLLTEELKCVNLYLEIEKYRLGYRFEFLRDIDAECYEKHVPTFLLLPLFEDIIRYGVEQQEDIIQIFLSGKVKDEGVILEISDNSEEHNEHDPYFEKRLLTVENIKEKLNSIYGHKASIAIEALVPSGARVKIILP